MDRRGAGGKDGADVVALLSSDGDLDEVLEHINERSVHRKISPGCARRFSATAKAQGAPLVSWDNVLNFIPEYLQAQTATGWSRRRTSMHLGTRRHRRGLADLDRPVVSRADELSRRSLGVTSALLLTRPAPRSDRSRR